METKILEPTKENIAYAGRLLAEGAEVGSFIPRRAAVFI